jgi:uncharacterized membrane protein YvbJ
MTSELFVCNSCGFRNSASRTACLQCGTSLRLEVAAPIESNVIAEPVSFGNAIKWALIGSLVLIAIALFYHYVITVPKLETANLAAARERQEQLAQEAKIKAEEAAAERARVDAAWAAEQELRKQQQTAQSHAQIEKDFTYSSRENNRV